MCGIVGYIGDQAAAPILIAGLERLEYRGYDSAGIALINRRQLKAYKSVGKITRLKSRLPAKLAGKVGIGHTRWATHGVPNDVNAHPHVDGRGQIAVVHNGIIENATELRDALTQSGVTLVSDTDTEVLAHLIAAEDGNSDAPLSLVERVRLALSRVLGTYGIVVLDRGDPDHLVTASRGSPVIIGIGEGEMHVASDFSALVRHTDRVVHLDDGEIAAITTREFKTITLDNRESTKSPSFIDCKPETYERGQYAHYLHKEICEQVACVERTLSGRLDEEFHTAHLGGLNLDARELLSIRRIKILGCGSAYYSGIAGAHLIESLARIPSDAEPAAEFRYRNPVIESDTLYIVVSQSGETFDSLAAVREVRRKGGRVLGIVNVVGSSIAREVDGGIYIHAGPEVSVASTKTFTCTITALALLALNLGRIRDLSLQQGQRLIRCLKALPEQIRHTLQVESEIQALARKYAHVHSMFYIGRAIAFPIALEGAQKLKEISYIHAEAYPSSELKHGPLALICKETPTVVVLPDDELYAKSRSSLEEIRARSGPMIVVSNSRNEDLTALADDLITVPGSDPILSTLLLNIPLQLFAYHCALTLGRDIDQPRNLAKSVTVE